MSKKKQYVLSSIFGVACLSITGQKGAYKMKIELSPKRSYPEVKRVLVSEMSWKTQKELLKKWEAMSDYLEIKLVEEA